MNIVISGELFGFPNGMAASNHVKLIAKGLVNAGSNVHIIIPNYTERADKFLNKDFSGVVEGISYEYTTGTPILPSTTFQRRWGKLKAYLITTWRLFSKRFFNSLDALILYSHSYQLLVVYSYLCRLLNVPLVVYIVEWTLANCLTPEQEEKTKRFYAEVFERADAVVVISHYIKKLANQKAQEKGKLLPCLRVPILCDPKVWQDVKPTNRSRPYLLFCADLDNYLDDVLFVLETFSQVRVMDIDLLLVGRANRGRTRKTIQQKAEELKIQDNIVLKNHFLPTEELHSLYSGATALLAPLFNSERSLARFPSKIADYLMSGRPVVSSKVGEVAEYLQDGETAFLSAPDSVSSFAAKIEEALINNERSDLIGQQGKKVATEQFNYLSRGEELQQFLNSLRADS